MVETAAEAAIRYRREGWWGDTTIADHVTAHAAVRPDAPAYLTPAGVLTWAEYDRLSTRLAGVLVAAGITRGRRVAVLLPDAASIHVAFLANEKAGLTTVGIGARAGDREVMHLLGKTQASALITHAPARRAADMRHVVVPRFEREPDGPITVDGDALLPDEVDPARRVGPDGLFLVNSTSGTTGLPKCVMHSQNRWMYFHQAAAAAGALTGQDVILGAVPAPFGFGLWTAHVTPTVLGATSVVTERFDAGQALELIARHRVTVLCAVSTQFLLMMRTPEFATADLTSLRVMFTGGEAVPYGRARDFEERTGATILQFYGSNESGLACGTRLTDPPDKRLRTAGRAVAGTELRLFADGHDVTATGRGQPGTRGPAVCLGYLDDEEANRALFTEDGFVLHADICTIDEDGWVSVAGRTADIIIRGGKNISAAQVEDEASTHPAVAIAAAVAASDETFGERVCLFVELAPGARLTLEDLTRHLDARGVSKELWPEHLVVVDELPRSSGGKIAKGALRDRVREDGPR